jgi:hypothetical protein
MHVAPSEQDDDDVGGCWWNKTTSRIPVHPRLIPQTPTVDRHTLSDGKQKE